MTDAPVRSSAPAPAAVGRLRVGDAERDAVAGLLAGHHAAGRLTAEELESRLDATLTAHTRNELTAQLVDLPAASPPVAQVAPKPAKRPALDPSWRPHLLAYVAVIAGLWLVWALTGMGHAWPIYPMFGWGLGLLGHRAGGSACGARIGGFAK